MKRFLLIILLCLTPVFAVAKGLDAIQPADENAARIEYDCPATIRRICRNPESNFCEAVYLSADQNPACGKIDAEKKLRMCGSENATLFLHDKECLALPPAAQCPATLNAIQSADVEKLASCPAIQSALCMAVCGEQYTTVDIRNAYQTNGKPAVICLDGQPRKSDNDPQRRLCTGPSADGVENHFAGGSREWCITYDKTYNNIALGAFVQCAGRLK